ncbi:uncharacterized protein RJT20DRAFT_132316 [Scheffersomyces xylosifermentans]|uniref:uncharacterized protein n=1 Tax=Scheffersomyces xylosifermentans TaxID=1304137 RepID=UPI00315D3E2F
MKLISFNGFIIVSLLCAANLAKADESTHLHSEAGNDIIQSASSEQPKSSEMSHSGGMSMEKKPVAHEMHHPHGMPILQTELSPLERQWWENYNTTTYFNTESKHKSALYVHIILGLLTVIFVYPVALVFNNLKLKSWYLTALVVHTTLLMVSLFNYSIFINSIPELYPGNAYNKMTWILFFSTIIQLFAAFINFGYQYLNSEFGDKHDYYGLTGSSDEDFGDEESSCSSPAITLYDLSRQGTTSNSLDLNGHSDHMKTSNNAMLPPSPSKTRNPLFKLFDLPFFRHVNNTLYKVANYTFNFLNWGHFFYFLIYIPTGVATFLLYGKGKTVFNLLAHFIKGGVFFSFGVLTLARYSGAFSKKGWAWNHKFVVDNSSRWNRLQSKGLITMEGLESSLILFYGCTNIFLEHLSDAGKGWSPKDLQHASIAFIYIGCGLCGVITENKLAQWRYEKAMDNFDLVVKTSKIRKILKASPGFSPNLFPVITIFWTGILMSKHQQASPLSTEIHIQWGNMFILACAFRFLTYLLVLLLPVNARAIERPSRPFTELIVSFGLICGGVIFMESTDPVIYSFEYLGLTSMFTLNVTLGFVTLFMGWEMGLFAFKDWLKKRSRKTSRGF